MALRLEIHHVDVSGGDCTIILIVDVTKGENNTITEKLLKSVMIDAGGVGAGPKKIVKYLKNNILLRFSDAKEMDYFIASHYHDDHIAGLGNAIKVVRFKNYIDIGAFSGKHQYSKHAVYKKGSHLPGYVRSYMNAVDYAIDGSYYNSETGMYEKEDPKATRIKIPFIAQDENFKKGVWEIPLVNSEIYLKCVVAACVLPDGESIVVNKKGTTDPNDQSLGFFLTWPKKDFKYFTAGDLSGDPIEKSYYDIEGPLLDYITKDLDLKKEFLPVTALKINHHGSERSSRNVKLKFLDTLAPRILILNANQKKRVPNVNFLTTHFPNYLDNNDTVKPSLLAVVNNMSYKSSSALGKAFKGLYDRSESNLVHNLISTEIKERKYSVFQNGSPGACLVAIGEPNEMKPLEKLYKFPKEYQALEKKNVYVGFSQTITLTEKEKKADAVNDDPYAHMVNNPIPKVLLTEIEKGFKAFFKWIIEKLNYENENEGDEDTWYIMDMVTDCYPALKENIEKINIPCDDIGGEAGKIAVLAMELFNKVYKVKTTFEGDVYYFNEEGTDIEKLDTVTNLLYRSPEQIEVNEEVFFFTKQKQWKNYELIWPHTKEPEMKKKLKEKLNNRIPKQRKMTRSKTLKTNVINTITYDPDIIKK